jgi:hypothetical protein
MVVNRLSTIAAASFWSEALSASHPTIHPYVVYAHCHHMLAAIHAARV